MKISSEFGSKTVRVLLDSRSQRTYITEELAKNLKLKRKKEEEINLATFGNEICKVVKSASTKLGLRQKTETE